MLLLVSLSVATEAVAHEVKPVPKFGGHVLEADEVFFEVVSKADRTLIYVEDDGKPLNSASMQGSLTFQLEGKTKEEKLRPGGFNLLHAEFARPPRGTQVAVQISLGTNQRLRFLYMVR